VIEAPEKARHHRNDAGGADNFSRISDSPQGTLSYTHASGNWSA